MVYRKIDFKQEVLDLEKYRVCTWSGRKQRQLIVTIENGDGEKINRKYYFTDRSEYSKFIGELRKLEV